jgi:hypothetical protein
MIRLNARPLHPSPASKLYRRHTGSLRKRDKGGDGRGAESYDRQKASPSINYSILFAATHLIPRLNNFFAARHIKKFPHFLHLNSESGFLHFHRPDYLKITINDMSDCI